MRLAFTLLWFAGLSISLQGADWSLEIIPNEANPTRGSSVEAIVVLLTNSTPKDRHVWVDQRILGYKGLTFLITEHDGDRFTLVQKRDVPDQPGWNPAIRYLVRANGHFAWPVSFNQWTGFPANWPGSEKVTIQAQFVSQPNPDFNFSKDDVVKVLSPPVEALLSRDKAGWFIEISN